MTSTYLNETWEITAGDEYGDGVFVEVLFGPVDTAKAGALCDSWGPAEWTEFRRVRTYAAGLMARLHASLPAVAEAITGEPDGLRGWKTSVTDTFDTGCSHLFCPAESGPVLDLVNPRATLEDAQRLRDQLAAWLAHTIDHELGRCESPWAPTQAPVTAPLGGRGTQVMA